MPKYQFLPPLLPEEFEALKASIAERGVEVPIIVDQDGNIIDGFHRQRACDELRIFCPREVRHFESEADKLELILRLNCRRRQLNRKQKRELIAAYLVRDPQIADNFLAEILGGVSKNTVSEVRRQLEATCQIDKFEKLRGRDSKERPAKYRKIIANTPKEAEKAAEIVGDLPDNCLGKTLDLTSAKRRAKRQTTRRQRQELIVRAKETVFPEDVAIHHCELVDLEIPAGTVDLILTDVMWNEDAEQDWRDLGRMAVKWLKPKGLLATYIGQKRILRVAQAITDSGLHYQTCFCGEFPLGSHAVDVNGVLSRWRAVLIFSKDENHTFRKTIDKFAMGSPEKEWSHLQQTVQGARWLLEHLSDPGHLVVDPCLGTGTTAEAVATADAPRRFIGCDRNEEMVKIAKHRVSVAYRHVTDKCDESVSELSVAAHDPSEEQPSDSHHDSAISWSDDGHHFYPTPAYATWVLMDAEDFAGTVWEPACGDGAMSRVLLAAGYEVYSSDIADRGYGKVEDFLKSDRQAECVITNPPYSLAEEFVKKALECATRKVALFLPLSFLSSKSRFDWLPFTPLKHVHVFTNRVNLYPNGIRGDLGSGTAQHAWFVWEHGYQGAPKVRWLPPNATDAA